MKHVQLGPAHLQLVEDVLLDTGGGGGGQGHDGHLGEPLPQLVHPLVVRPEVVTPLRDKTTRKGSATASAVTHTHTWPRVTYLTDAVGLVDDQASQEASLIQVLQGADHPVTSTHLGRKMHSQTRLGDFPQG